MLVVDGPDLVGKTVFCKNLVRELRALDFPVDYLHTGPEMAKWKPADYERRIQPLRVCDRFFHSEVTYGTIFRNETSVTTRTAWRLQESIRAVSGLIVFILPSAKRYEEILDEHFREGEHEDYTRDGLVKIADMYHELLIRSPRRHWWPQPDGTFSLSLETPWPSDAMLLEVVRKYIAGQRWTDKGWFKRRGRELGL